MRTALYDRGMLSIREAWEAGGHRILIGINLHIH